MADQPIITGSFRWTLSEFMDAQSAHDRLFVQPKRRVLWLIDLRIFAGFVGLLSILRLAIDLIERAPLSEFHLFLVFLMGLATLVLLLPWFQKRAWKRHYEQRPDRDRLVQFQVDAEGLTMTMEDLSSSTNTWASYKRVVRTPKGFLFYPTEVIFQWLPNGALADQSQVDLLASMARQYAPNYSERMTHPRLAPQPSKQRLFLGGACLILALCAVGALCTGSLVIRFVTSSSFPETAAGALFRVIEFADSSTPVPHPADTLVVPLTGGDPPTLDPALATDTTSASVMVEIFSGLTTIGRDLKVYPDLADSWTISADGRTYTFRIRSDAKFANGKPITAGDFKYSFERLADPALKSPVALSHLGDIVGLEARWSGKAAEISGVQVVDDYTLAITIDAPKVYFPARLATPTAFVVDRENVEGGGRRWFRDPNGSGPYQWIDYVPGQRIDLERNPNYTGTPKPAVRFVTLWLSFVPTYLHRYVRGEMDSALIQLSQLSDVRDPGQPLNRELAVVPSFRLAYLGFNVQTPPFDDPKVRQAFAMAIDKPTMAREDLGGTATPAVGYFAPGFPGYNPDLKGWEYNPAQARQLLRESGYGDGQNFPPITLDAPGEDAAIDGAIRMIQQNLGIKIQLRARSFSTFLTGLYQRPPRYQMYSLGRMPEYPDPIYLDIAFHSRSADNAMAYSNPEVDALLERGRVELDPVRRIQIYQQAEQLILEDVPWVPLFFSINYWVTKPNVRDLIYPPFVLPRLKYVSLGNSK